MHAFFSSQSELILSLLVFIRKNLIVSPSELLIWEQTGHPHRPGCSQASCGFIWSSVLFIRISSASCSESDYLASQGKRHGIHLSSAWRRASSLRHREGVHSMIWFQGNCGLFGSVFSPPPPWGLKCACFHPADFSDFCNDPDWLWNQTGLIQRQRYSPYALFQCDFSTVSLEKIRSRSSFFTPQVKQLKTQLCVCYFSFSKAYVCFIAKWFNVNKNSLRLFKKVPYWQQQLCTN